MKYLQQNMTKISLIILLLLITPHATQAKSQNRSSDVLEIYTPSFKNNSGIPEKYTCDGEDISPPIKWKGTIKGVKSWAVVCHDPDAPAGDWVHWVIYNIPPHATSLPEGVPKKYKLSDGSKQGVNDFNKTGYNGPCPPPGNPHRYVFELFAVKSRIKPKKNMSMKELLRFLKDKTLAKAELIGLYSRK